jgi:hypothetical protein
LEPLVSSPPGEVSNDFERRISKPDFRRSEHDFASGIFQLKLSVSDVTN